MNRYIAPILLVMMLPACGLQPLYSGGSKGAVAATLGTISVVAIEGKNGWLMRNALNDRLGTQNNVSTQFRLVVTLDDRISGFGVRADDTSPVNGGHCVRDISLSPRPLAKQFWMRPPDLTPVSTS